MLPKTAIAQHLRADPSLVARWVRRGMPLHSLEAASAWHSAHVRPRRRAKGTAPVGGDAFATARLRREVAAAAREELALAVERGELLSRDDVMHELSMFARALGETFEALGVRIAPRLVGLDAGAISALINHEQREIRRRMLGKLRLGAGLDDGGSI